MELPAAYKQCNISWGSSNTSLISNNGNVVSRPHKPTSVTLTATLTYGSIVSTKTFEVVVEGYKEIFKGNVASGYIYSSYSTVTNEFFNTLDLIYCAFALVDADGGFTGSNKNTNTTYLNNMKNYVIPKAHKAGDWVVLSIGGGGQSDNFKIIAQSEELRIAFANNVVGLINTYGFDGVDIDWETPSSTEKANFTLLAKEVRSKVKANNSNHIVTAAIGAGKWQPPCYDLPNSIAYLDFVNMMAYGMTSNSGYHHNALYKSTSGKTLVSCSIDESIVIYNNDKIPNNKIIIGFGFYGVRQTRETTSSSWVNTESPKTLSYTSIKSSYLTNEDFIEYYDTQCEVPYLMNSAQTIFISYDNRRSVLAKCNYIKSKGLGGIMYWQNGQDTTGDLLEAMKDGLNK